MHVSVRRRAMLSQRISILLGLFQIDKVMYILAYLFLFITAPLMSIAQNPVDIKTALEREENGIATLTFSAKIEEGWHLYSTNAGEGPTSAQLVVEQSSDCELLGALEPKGEEIEKDDPFFGATVRYFENEVVFTQRIKTENDDFSIKGYFEYGACNAESCLPPTAVNFNFGKAESAEPKDDAANFAQLLNPVNVPNFAEPSAISELTSDESLWAPVQYNSHETSLDETSLWLVFWSCFASGLLALLTPCVWPIIPMTVSFFMKRTSSRRRSIQDAFIYGLSIVVIYLALGLLVSSIFDANELNSLSTNAILNIFFTVLLLVFGFSFLGAFDLSLPSSWSTATDQQANKIGGIVGIFLMAFTLSIVSFSCTGPIIGFLLVQVATVGNYLAPAVGMAGFSIALALPFSLFAIFPSMLNKLPRSGNWMNTLKVTLGFIEIAFALKFFSVADMAYGWHLLDRETFIAIWAALAIVLGLYFFNVIKFAHDDDDKHTGVFRTVCGTAALSFAIYLIPGLWGAPLKAVSAFTPPMSTQDFTLYKELPLVQSHDYEEGLRKARETGKPVIIDFTGYGCVNCRRMEQSVWTDERVARMMNEDFILVSLHVDDRTPLKSHVEISENGTETTLRTLGDKWSYLQKRRFGVAAQPFYVILSGNGELLAEPYTFNDNADDFLDFLQHARR